MCESQLVHKKVKKQKQKTILLCQENPCKLKARWYVRDVCICGIQLSAFVEIFDTLWHLWTYFICDPLHPWLSTRQRHTHVSCNTLTTLYIEPFAGVSTVVFIWTHLLHWIYLWLTQRRPCYYLLGPTLYPCLTFKHYWIPMMNIFVFDYFWPSCTQTISQRGLQMPSL